MWFSWIVNRLCLFLAIQILCRISENPSNPWLYKVMEVLWIWIAMFAELVCEVWFSSRPITNILLLAAIQQQYQVTYDSGVETFFVVHQSKHGISDMIFRMHSSGRHYYDPSEELFTFIETVDKNKLAVTNDNCKVLTKQGHCMLVWDFHWWKTSDWFYKAINLRTAQWVWKI